MFIVSKEMSVILNAEKKILKEYEKGGKKEEKNQITMSEYEKYLER